MIKRTLRLLGLPLLLLCWVPLVLYPLLWLLAIPLGYIYSGNQWYFFKQVLGIPNSYEEPIVFNLGASVPKNRTVCITPPYLSTDLYKDLWHWYWTDKPAPPRPTTF